MKRKGKTMKKETLKAHKKAARNLLSLLSVNTSTKVIKNKKKVVKPFLWKKWE